jgi:hypothetical protein
MLVRRDVAVQRLYATMIMLSVLFIMNISFLTRFAKTRKTNAVLKVIDAMRESKVFKRARLDVYSSNTRPKQLVIVLGQMHTVWKGNKIANKDRKKIVECQTRLCQYYAYYYQYHQVQSFGGEGIYEGMDTHYSQQISAVLYEKIEQDLSIAHPVAAEHLGEVAQKVLMQLGKQWHESLRGEGLKKVQQLAAAVSGQTLFHYLSDGKAQSYPIEGEKAYQHVLGGISHLGDQIVALEQKPAFRYVKQRGGKVKTEEEAQAVRQYNALVKEFNRLIGSDIRERATFELLKEKAQENSLLIFTMGIAHRKNYLNIVDDMLKETDIAFVFVTPPELLVNWWVRIGVPLVILGVLIWANA